MVPRARAKSSDPVSNTIPALCSPLAFPRVGCTPVSRFLLPLLVSFYFLVPPQTNFSGSQLQVTPSPSQGTFDNVLRVCGCYSRRRCFWNRGQGCCQHLTVARTALRSPGLPTPNVTGAEGEDPPSRKIEAFARGTRVHSHPPWSKLRSPGVMMLTARLQFGKPGLLSKRREEKPLRALRHPASEAYSLTRQS